MAFTCYYNVEIQMEYPNEATDYVMNRILEALGVSETAVDERETYRAVLFFKSEIAPEQMFIKIRNVLFNNIHGIHYVDTIYRWENEMNSDRYVVWADGSEKHYTGHVIYEEDE